MATIEEIVKASNKKDGGSDEANKYTLKSMKQHSEEIAELFESECADMMIHCLVLFKREGIDEVEVLKKKKKRKERFLEKIEGSPEII